jgi:Ras-related protein Rab-1A
MGLKQSKKKRNDKLVVNKKPARTGPLLKLIFVGDAGVGKTSLIERIADGKFTPDFVSYTPDFKEKKVQSSEGREVDLELWDTAGQERFRTITSSYYRGAHLVCLVCDVTSAESFKNVAAWRDEVERYASHGALRVLLANKIDLADKRVVSPEELKNYAERYDLPLFEVSAKTNSNVDETLQKCVDMLLERSSN